MKRILLEIVVMLMLSLTIDTASSVMDDAMARLPVRGIHQRGCEAPKKDYNFITEYKRLPQYRYAAAYKRFPDYLYSFGIGKRSDEQSKRFSPYSFGVGKRNPLDKLILPQLLEAKNYDADFLIDNDPSQQTKRNAPWHAYGFGIGKRAAQYFNHQIENDNHQDLNNDMKINENNPLWDQY